VTNFGFGELRRTIQMVLIMTRLLCRRIATSTRHRSPHSSVSWGSAIPSRAARRNRARNFFRIGLSDPESVVEDASLVTTAGMSGVEAIFRELPKIEFGPISIRQPSGRVGHVS
jgi:hypothetical protein